MFWSDLPQNEKEMKNRRRKKIEEKKTPFIEMEAGSVIIFYLCQRQKSYFHEIQVQKAQAE